MDLTQKANADHAIGDVAEIFKGVVNIAKSSQQKKMKAAAQKGADEGRYWELGSQYKKLIEIPYYAIQQIQGKGITYEAVVNYPGKAKGTPIETIIAELQFRSAGTGATQTGVIGGTNQGAGLTTETAAGQSDKLKKALPFIAGAVVIGLIVYFIVKK